MPELIQEPETPMSSATAPRKMSRRNMLMTFGIALNAVAGVLFAVPVVGYIFGPARRKEMKKELAWITLGPLTQFPEGQTRLATYRNPFVRPWDGDTGNIPCWVRRISADKLQVFAINCAHLGCPVRWYPRLTAPILGALCGGIHNRDCSCARVTVAHIMPMAAAPRGPRLAVFSNTTTN